MPQWPSKVIPAQLAFLAIYNPSLGPTDDTFRDQLVFYFSRAAIEARVASKKNARNDAAGGDALREEENEKLRQIGLAQGMVDFAKSFSSGEPVDSIETEKSRIVLYELEKGWWILASIDLTRLPSLPQASSEQSRKPANSSDTKPKVEYSSREVSPPALLIQQLLQAHYIFCLHHGPSLSDLFVRLTRDKFCSTLDRFWTRFARSWDILLHGNPAADIFSGVKLASGGELGFGVGEEEWGSGEREVLEDLARRTEGLVDLVVARFGEPATNEQAGKGAEVGEEALPWMGGGTQPIASDGMIFGGIGAIQRHSLRDVSLWMRQIYSYGENAYGVKDNPLRERRKRRRGELPERAERANGHLKRLKATAKGSKDTNARSSTKQKASKQQDSARSGQSGFKLPVDARSEIPSGEHSHGDAAAPERSRNPPIEDSTPTIPPPIIPTVAQDSQRGTSHKDQETGQSENQHVEVSDEPSTTLGIPDQYMKYLTFGLSTLGKQKTPSIARQPSATNDKILPSESKETQKMLKPSEPSLEEEDSQHHAMKSLEPMPEGEALKSKLATQILQENRGHFAIGLKGDLLDLDELSSDDGETEDSSDEGRVGFDNDGSRIVLRTLQLEVVPQDGDIEAGNTDTMKYYRRLRVVLYVHRPFMYCFLFEDRTSSLQYTGFYRSLHRNLVPIHKPLLSSTSVEKVKQRIENSHTLSNDESGHSSGRSLSRPTSPSRKATSNTSPIHSLIYDPYRLTLHTSVPNIPDPGTPAAEGIFTSPKAGYDSSTMLGWTRIEALNVHSQILNTLASVRSRKNELERTSKTNRGWWVVWMKVPPSGAFATDLGNESSTKRPKSGSSLQTLHSNTVHANDASSAQVDSDMHRIAFLIRKASDAPSTPKTTSGGSRAVSSMLEVMSLGMAGRDESTVNPGDGWGPAALTGGIGIDARRYVEGLLSLNR